MKMVTERNRITIWVPPHHSKGWRMDLRAWVDTIYEASAMEVGSSFAACNVQAPYNRLHIIVLNNTKVVCPKGFRVALVERYPYILHAITSRVSKDLEQYLAEQKMVLINIDKSR